MIETFLAYAHTTSSVLSATPLNIALTACMFSLAAQMWSSSTMNHPERIANLVHQQNSCREGGKAVSKCQVKIFSSHGVGLVGH